MRAPAVAVEHGRNGSSCSGRSDQCRVYAGFQVSHAARRRPVVRSKSVSQLCYGSTRLRASASASHPRRSRSGGTLERKKVDLEGVAIEIVASGALNEAISLFRQAYNEDRRCCSARIQFVLHHALFRNRGPRSALRCGNLFHSFRTRQSGAFTSH